MEPNDSETICVHHVGLTSGMWCGSCQNLAPCQPLTVDELRSLIGCVQRTLVNGETGMSDADCNRAGWHVGEALKSIVETILIYRVTAAKAEGRAEGLREALAITSSERAMHLIASSRAPAAGPLFRVEQALRAAMGGTE